MSFHILRSSNIESACLVILFHLRLLQKFSAGNKLFEFCLLSEYMEVSFFGENRNKYFIWPDNDDVHRRYIHYNIKPVLKTSRTTIDNQTYIANFSFPIIIILSSNYYSMSQYTYTLLIPT